MPNKPDRPYPDFPLFPHANGQWAKKINGRMADFGPWSDWQGALRKYHALKDGPPRSLRACVDKYLESRQRLHVLGEIGTRNYKDMERTLNQLAGLIDAIKAVPSLTSEDFGIWRAHLAKTNGPVALGNHIMRVRAFLNWCKRERIITELPPGDTLKKPSRQKNIERAAILSRCLKPDGPENWL